VRRPRVVFDLAWRRAADLVQCDMKIGRRMRAIKTVGDAARQASGPRADCQRDDCWKPTLGTLPVGRWFGRFVNLLIFNQ